MSASWKAGKEIQMNDFIKEAYEAGVQAALEEFGLMEKNANRRLYRDFLTRASRDIQDPFVAGVKQQVENVLPKALRENSVYRRDTYEALKNLGKNPNLPNRDWPYTSVNVAQETFQGHRDAMRKLRRELKLNSAGVRNKEDTAIFSQRNQQALDKYNDKYIQKATSHYDIPSDNVLRQKYLGRKNWNRHNLMGPMTDLASLGI